MGFSRTARIIAVLELATASSLLASCASRNCDCPKQPCSEASRDTLVMELLPGPSAPPPVAAARRDPRPAGSAERSGTPEDLSPAAWERAFLGQPRDADAIRYEMTVRQRVAAVSGVSLRGVQCRLGWCQLLLRYDSQPSGRTAAERLFVGSAAPFQMGMAMADMQENPDGSIEAIVYVGRTEAPSLVKEPPRR